MMVFIIAAFITSAYTLQREQQLQEIQRTHQFKP